MASTKNDRGASRKGASADGGTSGATLSFLGMANIAVRLVNAQYPGSQLLEGDGISPSGPTTNPQNVNQWRFVFRTKDGGTAFIRTRTWGEFYPIEYTHMIWVEDIVIPWPIKMDITEADRLLKQAGYTQPYYGCTLRWPLTPNPDVKEPYYIFTMGGGRYVFVGVYDGKVSTSIPADSAQGSKKGSKKSS